MAKKWFPELLEEIEIKLEVSKNYYAEQKLSDDFYDYQNLDGWYEVRGKTSIQGNLRPQVWFLLKFCHKSLKGGNKKNNKLIRILTFAKRYNL